MIHEFIMFQVLFTAIIYQALQAYLTAFHYCFNVRIKSLFLNLAMGAIEATGILNIQGQIQSDRPIPQAKNRLVRVILLMPEDELNEQTWLDTLSNNPSFAFLNDPEEDIYTLKDGQPVAHEG